MPSALRTEAMNFRRGHGGGLFGGPPHHHGNMPRPPRNLEQMMGGRLERDELERQMDLVVNRIRREAGHPLDGELGKKHLPDPREIAFD